MTATQPARPRRAYDNTLRRERAAQTRQRIVAAAADLVRSASIRDWRGVTVRAVAARAGVNERTVYRHFASERSLHDAVLRSLEEEADIDLADMQLGDVADVTTRLHRAFSSYAPPRREPLDPTLAEAGRRLHGALLAAVGAQAPGWSTPDRTLAAGVLDVLWSFASYQRLVLDWQLDRGEAARAVSWVIDLVGDAVRDGHRPPSARPANRAAV